MAAVAAADGIGTIVATPHIREDYPVAPEELPGRVEDLNRAIAESGTALRVVPGGEVAMSRVLQLDDATIAGLCFGDGPYLLVESPYGHATELVDRSLHDAQVRGFKPVLAHPERNPSFLGDPARLSGLVDRGVLCSVTAASMAGSFGRTVQRFTARLFEEGLVHNVASDAHDALRRAPGLRAGFERLDDHVPGVLEQVDWFTEEVPRAILAGEELPPQPAPPRARRPLLGRLLRR